MKRIKLIDFLKNHVNKLYVMNCSLNYVTSSSFFEKIHAGLFCENDINLGVLFFKSDANSNYLVVDGKKRIISLMLLLKTSKKNHAVYKDILPKLKLFGFEKTVYEKILKDEILTYNEKMSYINKQYQDSKDLMEQLSDKVLCSLIERITIDAVDIEDINERDVYYSVNKEHSELNHSLLLKSYLDQYGHQELITDLMDKFNYDNEMFTSFFKAYLSPKFGCIITDDNSIYDYFVKYIETIKKYQKIENIVESILYSSDIYKKMYHAEFADIAIRNAFIKILTNDGKDTFSYLLELCEDYKKGVLSKEILLEICNIIITYTHERQTEGFSNTDFDFSKMVVELNQLIYNEQIKNQPKN